METLFFRTETVREFLRANKKELEKYNELLTALILSNFHHNNGVKDLAIGFKISSRAFHSIPKKGRTSLQQIKQMVDIFKDDDTPIDIVVAFESIEKIDKQLSKGESYQIKRFREHEKGDATKPLIDYLNEKIPRKYAKTSAKLVLVPEKVSTIDWAEVERNFKSNNYPFIGVMFFVISEGNLCIGEIWPTGGFNKYEPSALL